MRMGADSKKPEAERRNYKNVVDALTRISKEEGVAALWAGAAPTIARACLLNAGQLGVYSEAKEVLSTSVGLSGIPLQFVGSLIASVAANSTNTRMHLVISLYTYLSADLELLGASSRPLSYVCWPDSLALQCWLARQT